MKEAIVRLGAVVTKVTVQYTRKVTDGQYGS